jgi:uncharacterized protein YbbC (DUF1343 family)
MTPIFLLTACHARVQVGVDVLRNTHGADLDGAHVALITNHTGVDDHGTSTADIIRSNPTTKLVCILSPEHGFTGTAEHGQLISDSSDAATNVPIHSLYGPTKRPTDEMLKDVDTIVFDIQDIGTRFYTYITTMGMALEEAAKRNLRFVVLDRPNPIRGDIMEGDLLDVDIRRMTGYFRIPVRHGMTVGEIATWMNQSQNLNARLYVVKMTGWTRSTWFNQTGQKFIPPSPNMPTVTAALLYPGVGCFEATNVSVGRGTDAPFEYFGAPWIDGKALAAYLTSKNFPGVKFKAVEFTPTKDIYKGERCQGVRVIVKDRDTIRPFQIFAQAFLFLNDTYKKYFLPDWEEIRVVTGSSKLKEVAEGKLTFEQMMSDEAAAREKFRGEISASLLY